jgi:hypothetical protein
MADGCPPGSRRLAPWREHGAATSIVDMPTSPQSIAGPSAVLTDAGRLRRATIDDARGLLRTPFALTRSIRTPESGLRRLRVRDGASQRAWRFDVVMNMKHFADGDTIADNYSAAVVELGVRFDGRVGFARRGFLRKPVRLDAPEATAGSAALHDRYDVRASSPALAAQILAGPLDDWLCGAGCSFHYELVHDRVLAYGWRRYVGGNAVLRAAEAFATRLGTAG